MLTNLYSISYLFSKYKSSFRENKVAYRRKTKLPGPIFSNLKKKKFFLNHILKYNHADFITLYTKAMVAGAVIFDDYILSVDMEFW